MPEKSLILDWIKAGIAGALTLLALAAPPAAAGELHSFGRSGPAPSPHPVHFPSYGEQVAELHEEILRLVDEFYSSHRDLFAGEVRREIEGVPFNCGPAPVSFESFKRHYLEAQGKKTRASDPIVQRLRVVAQRLEILLLHAGCPAEPEMHADAVKVRVSLAVENPAHNLLRTSGAGSFWEMSVRAEATSISPLQLKEALGSVVNLEHFANSCVEKGNAPYSRAPKAAWEQQLRERAGTELNEAFLRLRLAHCQP